MGFSFLVLILVPLLAHPATSHDGEFSQLEEEFEEIRNILALIPEKFFQLERTIDLMELESTNGSTVHADVVKFRQKFAGKIFDLVEDLFGIEANLRELYQEQPAEEDQETDEESNETEEPCGTWRLGMNMNPTDGKIMDYTNDGWSGSSSIGNSSQALAADYLDQDVWNHDAANYVAIVRHNDDNEVHAVKTFKIIYDQGYSLSEMFNSNNPEFYRKVVGRLVQDEKLSSSTTSATVIYDPIFSVGGDLAINWGFDNNGVRMVMTDGYLEASGTDSWSTRGLGAHYSCDPVAGTASSSSAAMEIASTYSYSYSIPKAIGTDYGSYGNYHSYTSSYGQYAIYVSEDASSFPQLGTQLDVEMELC